jgi:hypothetical protein
MLTEPRQPRVPLRMKRDKNLSALAQSNHCSKLSVLRNLLLDFKHKKRGV